MAPGRGRSVAVAHPVTATPAAQRAGRDLTNRPPAAPAGDDADDERKDGGEDGAAGKTFLKRRTQAVAPQRLDWSHVAAKTKSRIEDSYVLPRGRPSTARKASPPKRAPRTVGSPPPAARALAFGGEEYFAPQTARRNIATAPQAAARPPQNQQQPRYGGGGSNGPTSPRYGGRGGSPGPGPRSPTGGASGYAESRGYEIMRPAMTFREHEVPERFSPVAQLRRSAGAGPMSPRAEGGGGRRGHGGFIGPGPMDDLLVRMSELLGDHRRFGGNRAGGRSER
jgi:hypothetical protein